VNYFILHKGHRRCGGNNKINLKSWKLGVA